jgi:sec-independent protein translocase protein TatA
MIAPETLLGGSMIPFAFLSFANMGGWEWIIVLMLVLIFFGAGKLPSVFRQFGQATKAFRDGQRGDDEVDVSPSQIDEKKVAEAEEVRNKETA